LKAFARFHSSAEQALLAVNPQNTPVILGTQVANTNPSVISNAAGSATITLAAGGIYYLEGNAGASAGAGQGFHTYAFYNQTTSTFIGSMGSHAAGTSTFGNSNPVGPATAVVNTTGGAVTVTLSITAVQTNSSINQLPDGAQGGQSWVTVMQVG
jgi:hypothetical protein